MASAADNAEMASSVARLAGGSSGRSLKSAPPLRTSAAARTKSSLSATARITLRPMRPAAPATTMRSAPMPSDRRMHEVGDEVARDRLSEPRDRGIQNVGRDANGGRLIERPLAHMLDARFVGEQP